MATSTTPLGKVFGEDDQWPGDWLDPTFNVHIEWQSRGEFQFSKAAAPLVGNQSAVPRCHGFRYRSGDCPEWLNNRRVRPNLAVSLATKIGGASTLKNSSEPDPGRYIATIGPIQVACGVPFPWCNVVEPYSIDQMEQEHWTWTDMGRVELFLEESGKVNWIFAYG